jgi:thiopurine S-methyltransferase
MDGSFWHRKWERNEIAFHEREANPLLVRYFKDLSLPKGSRVFLPLCGKTLDIHWLLSRGYRVSGSELSKIAVEQLFSELGVEPNIRVIDQISRYSANNIDIFVGDIFSLSRGVLGQIDAIYDRAALVAFPEPLRDRYAAHLINITDRAPQLLISYDYDQRLLDGPPFSVSHEEVGRQYRESYDLKLLASADIKGGLKGKSPAAEHVWLLKKMMRE